MEHQEYATAGTVIRRFLERTFIVFTMGVLFTFALLRSEVLADTHAEAFQQLDAQAVTASVVSRGQTEAILK